VRDLLVLASKPCRYLRASSPFWPHCSLRLLVFYFDFSWRPAFFWLSLSSSLWLLLLRIRTSRIWTACFVRRRTFHIIVYFCHLVFCSLLSVLQSRVLQSTIRKRTFQSVACVRSGHCTSELKYGLHIEILPSLCFPELCTSCPNVFLATQVCCSWRERPAGT
jgi:hypothetical protein